MSTSAALTPVVPERSVDGELQRFFGFGTVRSPLIPSPYGDIVTAIMTKTLLGLALLYAGSAYAQTRAVAPVPQMELCSVPLTLGMTKSDFVDKVSENCELIKPSAGDHWLLKLKGPNGTLEGDVMLTDGRITKVSRSWTPTGTYGASDLARSLVSAVEAGLQGRDNATARVFCSTSHEPGWTTYSMTLDLPNHREVSVVLAENPAKVPGELTMLDVAEAIVK